MTVATGTIKRILTNNSTSFEVTEEDFRNYFGWGADAAVEVKHEENNPEGNLSVRVRGLEKFIPPGQHRTWVVKKENLIIDITHHHSKEDF